jgi:hypothetical protein
LKKPALVERMEEGVQGHGHSACPYGYARGRRMSGSLSCATHDVIRLLSLLSVDDRHRVWRERQALRKKTMPDPYASVIAMLYGVGLVLLVAALPARLKAIRRKQSRKARSLATTPQVDGGFELQTSSILTEDAKNAP